MFTMILVALGVFIGFITFIVAINRYKRCPADKVLVISGRIGQGRSAKCVHGGGAFVWPVIQEYKFLDLAPMTIDIPLKSALSKQNIRVNVPSRFIIGISTEPAIVAAAAERLLSSTRDKIRDDASDIILGQLRATIATMNIEEINADRENFVKKVQDSVETELKKIGLKFINVNITDITDESGYIEALGKKAAAEAINLAKVQVAMHTKEGELGIAGQKRIERIGVADADAKAVDGENTAKIEIAKSNALRREKVAEAEKSAITAEKTKTAEALELAYISEQAAESERMKRDQITQEIQVVVPADVERQKIEKIALAKKAQLTYEGEGEGLKKQKMLEGEAEGIKAILEKKAEGFKVIVAAAGGNPDKAAMLLIVEQLPEIVKAQAEAISKIKFDKIVVMDSGSNGTSMTANWLGSFTKMLPGLHEFVEMAGIELHKYLGDSVQSKAGHETDVVPSHPADDVVHKDPKVS